MPIDLIELNIKGWAEIDSSGSDEELISIAKSLGEIILHPNGNQIDVLKAKNKFEAIENTFSYNFEFKAFPLHTDTAFWNIPARYVLLSNKDMNGTATTITNVINILDVLSKDEMKEIKKSIFLVSAKNKCFYTKLISHNSNHQFFRYDSNCMKALNNSAKEAEKILSEKIKLLAINRIKWSKQKILVIDNWRTIHGRDAVASNENRVLKRIYIR